MTATPKKAAPRPTSNAKLAQRVDDLAARMERLESLIVAAHLQKQQEAAAKLAANPEQLQQLAAIVELARQAQAQ